MTSGLAWVGSFTSSSCQRPPGGGRLSGEVEVVQAGYAAHRVVHTVAAEAAVAQDLPGLHAGKDVLNAGPDLPVALVVRLLPVGEFFVRAATAVRDYQSRSAVAAVGDRYGLPDGVLRAGLGPGPAVIAVARQWPPSTTTSRVSASTTT